MAMQERNLRINEMASRIGMSGQGLRDILSGKSQRPKTDVVVSLAEHLGVSVNWLLSGDGAMAGEPGLAYGKTGTATVPVQFIRLSQRRAFIDARGELRNLTPLEACTLPAFLGLAGPLLAFETGGDTLDSDVRIGDYVVCADESAQLQYLRSGSTYAVLFGEQLVLAKVNNKLQTEGVVELLSSNPSLQPLQVPGGAIDRVYRVVLVWHRL